MSFMDDLTGRSDSSVVLGESGLGSLILLPVT